MSVTRAAGDLVKNLPNVTRLAIVKKPGHMAVPQIANELTAEMLPKSQIPKSGRVAPVPEGFFSKHAMSVGTVAHKMNIPKTMGLRFDDWCYDESVDADVKEALRRVDNDEVQLRAFRQMRASQLAFERMVCPVEERWELDDDVRYLHPWVQQVQAEFKESDAWDCY